MPDPDRPALLARLRAARVVPVVRTSTAAHAATVVGWLREAGISIFEITMTIPDAPALIRELSSDPSLLVGAGTVRDAAAAKACLAAGARFLVAPWVDAALAAPCRDVGALLMLGALSPTEVRAAQALGRVFCPANRERDDLGGVARVHRWLSSRCGCVKKPSIFSVFKKNIKN